jgi:hypothetical protein
MKIKTNITFTKSLNVSDEYCPKPATNFIPEWYKNLETRIPIEKKPSSLATVKKCIPVFDAITSGYIIVSPCDVYVSIEDGQLVYKSPLNIVEFHPMKQAHNHPVVNGNPFPKWINPWAIKTPKGYSTLFIAPMHNPNPWFEIMPGIVDTDTYTASVNFPFVLKDVTKEVLIPAGTPIAQLIPIKRSSWISEVIKEIPNKENPVINYLNSQFFDRYKKMFWNRKEYK